MQRAHDDDAESQRSQHIHRIVAFREPFEEGMIDIIAMDSSGAQQPHRLQEGDCNEHGQEQQEQWIQQLANPDQDLAWAQRERDSQRKECQRKEAKRQCLTALTDVRRQTDLVGYRGRTWQGKGRANRQIQQHRHEFGIGRMHAAGQIIKPAAARDANRYDAQERQTDSSNQETNCGWQQLGACFLSHVDREDQITGTEEHAKQHGSDEQVGAHG